MAIKEVDCKKIIFICDKCGYVWESRKYYAINKFPKVCANLRCHSENWNKKYEDELKERKKRVFPNEKTYM